MEKIQLTEQEINVIKAYVDGNIENDEQRQALAIITDKASKLLDEKTKEVFKYLPDAKPWAYKSGVDPVFWLWQQYQLSNNHVIILTGIEKRMLQLNVTREFEPMGATEEEAAATNRIIEMADNLMESLDAYNELDGDLMVWFDNKLKAQSSK